MAEASDIEGCATSSRHAAGFVKLAKTQALLAAMCRNTETERWTVVMGIGIGREDGDGDEDEDED